MNARLERLARRWDVAIGDRRETATALVAYGTRRGAPVVLKVVRESGDEWHSGEVLAAFGGGRFAEVLEHTPGALLIERLEPGTSLVDLVGADRDDEATEAIASIAAQRPTQAVDAIAADTWIASFQRYAAGDDRQIDSALVAAGMSSYARLCATQSTRRLLHGDLQHSNVLSSARGWVAIDPKGVVAEPAFEAGAFLRNPHCAPEVVRDERIVMARADRFSRVLGLDAERVLEWGFAQAVLSLIWSREDGDRIDSDNSSLVLAQTLLPRFA